MAAAYLAFAGAWEEAIAAYDRCLIDVESPPAWQIAQLCRAHQRMGDVTGVYDAAARLHPWDLDFEARRVIARAMKKARVKHGPPDGYRPYRIALLSTFTTTPIEACLVAAGASLKLDIALYVPEFDQLRAESANPASDMYRHNPDVVLLATTWRDIQSNAPVDTQADEWQALWDILASRTRAHVLQHNFDRPPHSALGHLAARTPRGIGRVSWALNDALAERAGPRVSLVDYAQAVTRYGADRWCDARQWHWAKEAVSTHAAPFLVEEYLAVLRGLVGKTRKVLVLDLDNTLWGGVVGEDLVGGIRIGPPSAEGESHLALQLYARALRERGVLLAVCSKNNDADAREPFEQLSDMALQIDDFVAFEATWDTKPERVRKIAAELNLGLDSFVFIDDNPAERAMMRRACPEVLTIPVPADPSGYVAALDRARAFEVTTISTEDRARTETYRAQSERQTLRSSAGSLEEYYASLQMVGVVRPFAVGDLTRVVQLAARSNQFNLTTWRLTMGEVEQLMVSPTHVTRTLRLRDRFGDHGLVLVLITEVREDDLHVLAWFMSCRVIGRTVEQLVLAELEAIAIVRGCTSIVGTRIPTKKNVLVKDLFANLGFDQVSGAPNETSVWRRRVVPSAVTANPYITIERLEEPPGA